MRIPICAILIISISIASCSESDLEISNLEPGVRVEFINQDSLVKAFDAIDLINTEVALVDDSLGVIDSLILAGATVNYENEITTLNETREALLDERSSLNEAISIINSGSVLLEKIESASGEITFKDSATFYRFPLDMTNNQSEYSFSIFGDSTYSFSFSYERDTIIDIENILIQVDQFKVDTFSPELDSVTYYPCDTTNCLSNEVLVTVYF